MRPFLFAVASAISLLAGSAWAMNGREPSSVTSAPAVPMKQSVQWRCWYNQAIHIHCLLEEAPAILVVPAKKLPAELPPLARALYTKPAGFRRLLIRIPLHNQPDDTAYAAMLAESAVCGNNADCSVRFTEAPPAREEIALILERQEQLSPEEITELVELDFIESAPGRDESRRVIAALIKGRHRNP